MKMLRIFDILDHLKEYGNKDILARREADGKWKKYTIDEYVEHAYAISSALLELGVKKGDKVATIMQNRPEWNFLTWVSQWQVASMCLYIRRLTKTTTATSSTIATPS